MMGARLESTSSTLAGRLHCEAALSESNTVQNLGIALSVTISDLLEAALFINIYNRAVNSLASTTVGA
jgi:hypothetical protein